MALTEAGKPVFTYNFGMMLAEGVPADRRRCCYLHPVHAPNGAVVTDDFPKDHYHHRGIAWMWPVVKLTGVRHNLWEMSGMDRRFVRWLEKKADGERAVLGVENEWRIGGKTVAREQVTMVAYREQAGSRDLDFTLRLEATGSMLELSGAPEENKGYGGFNIRFAPREKTTIRTLGNPDAPDSNNERHGWAELRGVYQGKAAAVRITDDKGNPDWPVGWCLRHYGFLGANFPGTATYRLEPGKPLVLRYQITLRGD
jgi:hypothetical protein